MCITARVNDGRAKYRAGSRTAEPEQAGILERMLPERGPHTPTKLHKERKIPRTTENRGVQNDHGAT